nr:hypothetical protein [Paenibacillus bovis]
MSKTNISRCTVNAAEKDNSLSVKVINSNKTESRQFDIKVYKKETPNKLLAVTPNSKEENQLRPGAEKIYTIDTSTTKGKLIFEISQYSGGSGLKVSKNSNRKHSLEIHLK